MDVRDTPEVEAEPQALRCKNHAGTETYLRCGKCGEPICARCVVITPVGARCRQCARLRRLPTFELSPKDYLRAFGGMIGAAAVGGLLAGFLRTVSPYAGILIPLALGYFVGEIVALATNRKRVTPLKVIAALGVLLAVALQPLALAVSSPAMLSPSVLLPMAVASLLGLISNFFGLIGLGLGIYIAVNRF